jgi:hypothetical protein
MPNEIRAFLVLCPADNFAKSFEFGQDGFGRSGPHEGPGVLIVVFDELMDFAFQVRHPVEAAAAGGALRDQPEGALDLIEPGGVGGSVVNVESWAACQPRLDFGVFVRAVIPSVRKPAHDAPGPVALELARGRLIPLSEAHLHVILKSCIGHYNQGVRTWRLGPGVPDPAIRENAHTRREITDAAPVGCFLPLRLQG